MRKVVLFITVFFISYSINAQEFMKKIQLKEGVSSTIKHDDLTISTLLQVYDEKSAAHLIGDMYLKVDNNGEPIAGFYIDNDKSTKEYDTKIYKNYFLTFMIENNNKYLIIEQAQFGKAFALSSHGSSAIGNKDDLVGIEIMDYVHEWGYDAPSEDGNSNYFDDVQYTLQVKVRDVVKSFSFYSSEVKDNFVIDLERYSILILSDVYKDSSSLIEMIVNKK
ncbi:hypothetical protein [Aquimarina sp. 2304DJ70-9]|uniref:hypothetical protein n=1 Tax=Aquimarina penaris TaxID=3231044 RepID=UPI0034635C88